MEVHVTLNTVVIGLITAAVAWLFKTTIQHGNRLIAIETAFKFYLERSAAGAARVLDSPNPTPPEMRDLLKKFRQHEISAEEHQQLVDYLRSVTKNPSVPKSEQSAAWQMLTSIETLEMLPPHERN